MGKFMIGDRVQLIGEPTDYNIGTITHVGSDTWDGYCNVKWDSSRPGRFDAEDLFLVHRSQLNAPQLADLDDYAERNIVGGVLRTRFSGESEPDPLPHWSKGSLPTFAQQVDTILNSLGTLLKAKNEAYGDSALNPIRIFSQADPADGLRVRIDDKLSRIARGSDAGEDTVTDLLGYLVMLKISEGNK